jgi:NAD(P) transhydrogenase subunit alpha
MSALLWILKVLVFFVALKVGQTVFWNVRKAVYVHPWVVELLVAVLVVILLGISGNGWWTVVLFGLLFGVIRGDQEEDTRPKRQLL